jgi:hypothetical protein
MSEDEIKECLDSLYYQDDFCSISYDKLKDYIIKLKTQLQQKENIIKEAREYMKTLSDEYAKDDYDIKYDVFNKLYYKILDKEVN